MTRDAMPQMQAIVLEHVSRTTDDGVAVLDDVCWSLAAGSAATIVGASGSGKSSLLRLCNALDEPSAGRISILGRDIQQWEPRELRTHAVWIPQTPTLGGSSVRDILSMPVEFGVISSSQFEERLPNALAVALVDEEHLDRDAAKLSGGERQRLALARALLLAPPLLLLDEPTSSLDGQTAGRLLEGLRAWQQQHDVTLVAVTHRLGDVRYLGGELLFLDQGRARFSGAAVELLESETGEAIRSLLAGDSAS